MVAAIQTLDSAAVYRLLDYAGCISAVREAMAALSRDGREQPLRAITDLGGGRLFGLMPGLMPGADAFGAKLVSVFPDPERDGRAAHRGVVVLFDGESGEIDCIADAGAVTHIRTACASAVATDALARPDAKSLAIFGCGAQAESHVEALIRVRPLDRIRVWGRDQEAARRLASAMESKAGVETRAVEDREALAADADIICTVTSAHEPILCGEWVRPGTHVNLVGSSYAGPREADHRLVAMSRLFVDYRRSALAAAAEFLAAKADGLITDAHIAGEIGEVLNGTVPGRRTADEITVYKSLGHIAQDLAAVRYVRAQAS